MFHTVFRSLLASFLMIALSLSAQATVTMKLNDFSSRAVELIYEVEDTLVGNRKFIFPQQGFINDDRMGEMEVISVFDKSTSEELSYRVIRDEQSNLPKISINYEDPVEAGKRKVLRIHVLVHLPASEIGLDKRDRYFFSYETSHPFEFVLPEGHMVVYSNQPILVFEREEDIILFNNETESRTIVIKTLPILQN